MHLRLHGDAAGRAPHEDLAAALGVGEGEVERLREALGSGERAGLAGLASRRSDLRIRLLAGSFSEYQRAAQLWWRGVERSYAPDPAERLHPVYFVSSNTHSLANLLGGYALANRDGLLDLARQEVEQAGLDLAAIDTENALYYALRTHLYSDPGALAKVQSWDSESGILSVDNSGHVDVDAQVIEMSRLRPDRFDPRLQMPGLERLVGSDARIINVDYPLGMAAYHLLSRLGQGSGKLLGIYLMGKAATLNGQVGDVMISRVVHDEHSLNTYLLNNVFSADAIAPWLEYGTVLDNQKAVTVKGPFLQNSKYLGVFYREGYSVLEMEAGPYMSALYELVDPRRHPNDQIVNMSERAGMDHGILHYASDTPYSRRQRLLSKSLALFGMDSTYACAIAITRRILECEIARLG